MAEVNKLDSIVNGVSTIPTKTQYLVSEITLIRLAALLEHALAEVAFKISSGAPYLDGTRPVLIHRCASMSAARTAMLTLSRNRPQSNLKWTRTRFIRDSVQHVIDASDNYQVVCTQFGSQIAEIFKVRNFAAHRNQSSRNDFKVVIQSIYGRGRPIQLGYFLLSPDFVPTPNLRRYIIEAKVLVNDLTKHRN